MSTENSAMADALYREARAKLLHFVKKVTKAIAIVLVALGVPTGWSFWSFYTGINQTKAKITTIAEDFDQGIFAGLTELEGEALDSPIILDQYCFVVATIEFSEEYKAGGAFQIRLATDSMSAEETISEADTTQPKDNNAIVIGKPGQTVVVRVGANSSADLLPSEVKDKVKVKLYLAKIRNVGIAQS